MTIENPISTTRKAVKGIAESIAEREFFKKPEPQHFQAAFDSLRRFQELGQEALEKFVLAAAEGKEIKDALGEERHSLFSQLMKEKTALHSADLTSSIEKIMSESESLEEANIKIPEMLLRASTQIVDEIRHDSRIISAFAGEDALLERVSKFSINSISELMGVVLSQILE
jgi:DNA-binding ferritin-like protein (Dps family)